MKINCWENKQCGREPGGSKVKELGICPAATEKRVNKINNGINGGRSCWAVAGTLCGGKVNGTAALKILNCMQCYFYKMVWKEENLEGTYTKPADIIKMLHD